MTQTRTERDTMGELDVPLDALWGAQTQRAVNNFPISGLTVPKALIRSLGLIKTAAATVNRDLDLLDDDTAAAIIAAAAKVSSGVVDAHFPIDIFQTGSGTSTNMNANEVIARLANQAGTDVHPNDHVNKGHSMRDAGILDGDLLAVHRTPVARIGQIVVARLDDEVTVKRFERSGHMVRLLPENPDFEAIQIDLRKTELIIEGLGVGVIRPHLNP